MSGRQIFDVIVVGGGPGGSVAAKRCAEAGFGTLLIEKKELPRDKVCTGMVMGAWAHDIIRQDFGDIPDAVLTDPPILTGWRYPSCPRIGRRLLSKMDDPLNPSMEVVSIVQSTDSMLV